MLIEGSYTHEVYHGGIRGKGEMEMWGIEEVGGWKERPADRLTGRLTVEAWASHLCGWGRSPSPSTFALVGAPRPILTSFALEVLSIKVRWL